MKLPTKKGDLKMNLLSEAEVRKVSEAVLGHIQGAKQGLIYARCVYGS